MGIYPWNRIFLQQSCLQITWFGAEVSMLTIKWLTPALTSYASSMVDVANPRFQTMNVWTVSPTFIVGDHFILHIPTD
jgi:hypothetical protein